MNTLGPHVIFSDSHPTAWGYFKLDPSNTENPVSFYTAPYASAGGDVTWSESPLEDKSPIYLYDTQEQRPSCYVMDANNLYDVPRQMLGGQPHVNAMRQINLEDHEITKRLANGKKARDYAVMVKHYPEPDNLTELLNHLPKLPVTEPAATTRVPSTLFISSDEAKAMLEVTQCIRVGNKTDCPAKINKGCMYVWKTDETWSFNVNFLGDLKTGAFDKTLDSHIIETLNTQPLGDITPEIDSIRHHLNRPYLNLTPHQQAILVATMTPDWPLSADISPDQQIQVCRAIIGGSALAEDMPQSTEINSNINAFRPYLFPSTINSLYGHNALFTSAPAPKIADIILYTDYLLMGAAQALGDKAPFTIPSPPKSSEVACGQLAGADNQSRLIYQGLSEGQSELFQFIMRAEMQGMEAMPIEDLIQMEPLLHAVMNPSERGHAFIELSNDLIASIAAQQNITHEAAKVQLTNTCERMIVKAHKTALIRLISMPQEEALAALQESTNADFNNLIRWLFNSSESAQANRDAVVQHQYPDVVECVLTALLQTGLLTDESAQANFDAVVLNKNPEAVAKALTTLHDAGLLTSGSAQANFNAVIQHQYPYTVAKALTTLHQAGLLTGGAAQANFNAVAQSQNLGAVADALAILYYAGLLTSDAAQANLNAVAQHQNLLDAASALTNLHKAGLLSGESAQANFNAVAQHQNPGLIAGALTTLHEVGLLTGESAQANRDAVARSQDPQATADALTTLHQTGLLTGESAQVNRDAVAQHQSPGLVAGALTKLHRNGLLTGDSAQANFNAVVQHQYPDNVAVALTELRDVGLLTGLTDESARTNLNAVTQHRTPGLVADALTTLHVAGLLTNESAQANFNTVVQHQKPFAVANTLTILYEEGLLRGESAQANFNAVAQSQNPVAVADALTQLHGAGLLTNESAQANRDAVASSQDPLATTKTLIQNKMKEDLNNLKPSSDDKDPGPRPR